MKQIIDLSKKFSQQALSGLVGITQPTVSRMIAEGKLPGTGTLGEELLAYCQRLREQAAGRLGDSNTDIETLDLVQERAGLAREQRIAQEIKNAVARKEYAPIGILADVLGMASSAVVDRMEQVEGMLAKSCPDLPEEARNVIQTVLADARNAWIAQTARLVSDAVDGMVQDSEDGG